MVILLIFLLVVIFIGGVYALLKVADAASDFSDLKSQVKNLKSRVEILEKLVD